MSAYIGAIPAYIQEARQAQDLAKNFFLVFDPFSRSQYLYCSISLGKQASTEFRTPQNPLIGAYAGIMQAGTQEGFLGAYPPTQEATYTYTQVQEAIHTPTHP